MVVGKINTSNEILSYTEIISNSKISEGDYIKNLGYVGRTLDGRAVIVIFENALCTSDWKQRAKTKKAAF